MYSVQLKIRYQRWVTLRTPLALGLLLVILLTALTVNRALAIAPSSPSPSSAAFGVRQYYLSRSSVQANEAPSVCVAGYHFASIWEIADPSGLKYNTDLGLTVNDSGAGPPTSTIFFGNPLPTYGWVRTGYVFSTTDPIGHANCGTWLSNYNLDVGTVANLPSNWTGGEQDIGVWNTGVRTCNTRNRVWCVQDDSGWRTYLPVVLK